jgi:hypothetical protein
MFANHHAQLVMASVPQLVHRFLGEAADLWWEGRAAPPLLPRTFVLNEQAENERQLQWLVDGLLATLQRPPRSEAERQAVQEHLMAELRQLIDCVLGPGGLEVLPADHFNQAAQAFVQQARRFDPALSLEDVFQAGRNAWTMNGLQWLLGLPVQATRSVVAYSLLYPYTDNTLDDPARSHEVKLAFNERFRRRLAGEPLPPTDAHERPIFDLIGMIEGQYPRTAYPQVYESLLAIHQGQSRSLQLLRRNASPYELDVLGISFEKGGTSVLADGYLVAGSLTPIQAQFTFGYGAFVQLVDDLEDVQQDLQAGRLSIYSLAAGRWPLDALANRTFHFGCKVLTGLDRLDPPVSPEVKDLIRTGANLLLIDTINRTSRLYSRGYLRELEAHFPFRFSAFNHQRQRLLRRRDALIQLVET